MSCDNIAGNGDAARQSVAAFAGLRDQELGAWVRSQVSFPNSMVDRITPVTTEEDRASVAERYGVDDRWPVVCELFAQWVLEDAFSAGRPPWQDVGVQLVDDVEPYELMKLRLLDASHQALCYLGHLAGYRLVHDVAQDPLFAGFLLSYMEQEGSPTLPPVPGIDGRLPRAARRALLERAGARHRGAAVRRELRPHPHVAAAGRAAQPAGRPERAARRDGRRELGATPRGSTSRASPSRSSTGCTSRSEPPRRGTARTRSRSCATGRCSATCSTSRAPSSPTAGRSTACTPSARAPPSRRSAPPTGRRPPRRGPDCPTSPAPRRPPPRPCGTGPRWRPVSGPGR